MTTLFHLMEHFNLKYKSTYKNTLNSPIVIYLLFGLTSFGIRLYFNFSQELIPGVNGGYYPLQVRSLLSNGSLGFPDMPLLFYLNAFLVKLISLFGFSITDSLIINVVKMVDSISIPLLLISLYKINTYENKNTSRIFEASLISFTVLSFSPLILTSDLQKNALAITFLFAFIAHLIAYQNNKKRFEIIFSIVFLILIGLTHFGTFMISLFFLVFMVGYHLKSKAMVPLSIIILAGLIIIAVFDISRLTRLLSLWSLLFEKPALTNGMLSPPDYLNSIISIVLAIVGYKLLRSKSIRLLSYQKGILFASILCLLVFSFPLLDGEYFKRLSLFLFIPQSLIILQIASQIGEMKVERLSVSIFLFTVLSLFAVFGHPKEPVINKNAYEDLKKLNSIVEESDETIIIARHGLEWWTAWALKTKVGQDKAIEGDFFLKYKDVVFLKQISGFSHAPKTPFHEPDVPHNSKMIYSSKYFKAYKVISDND
jgi:hypothetical protein